MMGRLLLKATHDGWPPSVNHMYRSTSGGRRYRTPEYRAYHEAAVLMMKGKRRVREPFAGRVSLTIKLESGDGRRRDIDNIVKAVQDCLAPAGVIKDDSQIDDLRVMRKSGSEFRTEIIVREAKIDAGT